MSKRSDRLITHIRSITENETANSSTDITNEEILQYINEAQYRLQAKIVKQDPEIFITETLVSGVANQEEYTLNSNAMLENKIIRIDYTNNASASRPVYHEVKRGSAGNRISHVSGIPSTYYRRDKLSTTTSSFIVSPAPSSASGQFRVTYTQKLDKLDLRRGIVSAVTLNSSALTITSLTLDISGNPAIDSTELANHEYFCMVNKHGVMQMRNIEFSADGDTSINTTTGAITIASSFVYSSGETIAVGDYLIAGKDSTTHSQLPEDVERYLIQFAAYKIFKRDSSNDVSIQFQEVSLLEDEIVQSYQLIDESSGDIVISEEWS